MAGIYIHIPFCKSKCFYCDFFKTTDLSGINDLLQAIKQEIIIRRDFLTDQTIHTIYFGGGTPSLLSVNQINELLDTIHHQFHVVDSAEITLEANPDDITFDYLLSIKKAGINRLSMGVQSFDDEDLRLMGRRHHSQQAIEAVGLAQKAGFNNISLDLIYGIPGLSLSRWKKNLEILFSLSIQHLSAYHLTYHEGTRFWKLLAEGSLREIDEDISIGQFELLLDLATQNEFIHYEISNFSREGFFSKHNCSYWQNIEYLGVGPSAHSYNGNFRYWNDDDVKSYIQAILNNKPAGSSEVLTLRDKYNDYIITSIRTIWGCSKDEIVRRFGQNSLDRFIHFAAPFIKNENIQEKNGSYVLTKSGIFVSDFITEKLTE